MPLDVLPLSYPYSYKSLFLLHLDSNPTVSISQKGPNDSKPIVSTTDFCHWHWNESYSSDLNRFSAFALWKLIYTLAKSQNPQMPLFQAISRLLTSFSWQRNDGLHVARLLQIDVKCVAKSAFVRGNLSKRVFSVKHTDFYPCAFSETGQRPCSYL